MEKFAVGYLNFFENELIVEVVEAEDWFDAIKKHSKLKTEYEDEYLEEMCSEGMEMAKNAAFDGEWTFDVKKVAE